MDTYKKAKFFTNKLKNHPKIMQKIPIFVENGVNIRHFDQKITPF